MAERQRNRSKSADTSAGFSDEERAAMRERARELKAEARRGANRAEGERELLAKIADLPEPDRGICLRIHAIVTANAPELLPRTWYGMPAYANSDGKVVLFFRDRQKFKERYLTLGFNESANLDDGSMWPVVFALTDLTPVEEARIADLVRKAVAATPL